MGGVDPGTITPICVPDQVLDKVKGLIHVDAGKVVDWHIQFGPPPQGGQ